MKLPEVEALSAYLDATLGSTEGYAHTGFGYDQYLNSDGKVKHGQWEAGGPFAWPAERERLIADLLERSRTADAYLCPYVTEGPRRAKGQAVVRALAHTDADTGELDLQLVRELGAWAVDSGTPGHAHVYLQLAEPVSQRVHERLCRALAARLGGDPAKVNDNDVLRPPGTWNRKPTAAGDDPTPVRFLIAPDDPSVRVWPVAELAAHLGVNLADPVPGAHDGPATPLGDLPQVDPETLTGRIKTAFDKRTKDRSADTYRLIATCREQGWTLDKTTALVMTHQPSLEKRGDPEAVAADVHRIWGKMTENAPVDRLKLEVTNAADFSDWLTAAIGTGPLSGLFLRAGRMIYVPRIGEDGYEEPKEHEAEDGPAQIREVTDRRLEQMVESGLWLYRTTQKGYEQHVVSPAGIASRKVAAADLLPNLRRLRGVVHTPLLRPDGSLFETPGYDSETRLLLLPDIEPLPVPDDPSIAQITAAHELLQNLLGEFPWRTPHDFANYLGALALPFLRLLVPLPWQMLLINAHSPGSGKTMLSTILRLSHGGVQRPMLPTDSEELRKQIASVLATTSGQVVVWDNTTGVIQSGELANLLSSTIRSDRMLGKMEDRETLNDRLWVANGNNLQVAGDIPRRVFWVTIDPNVPHPELRTGFTIASPDQWVRGNLALLRQTIHTLLRAWVLDGMPRAPQVRSDDYGTATEVLSGVVPYLLPDRWREGEFAHEATVQIEIGTEDEEWFGFLTALRAHFETLGNPTGQFVAADVIQLLLFSSQDGKAVRDRLPSELQTADRFKPLTAARLGSFFRNREGRFMGTVALRSYRDEHAHVNYWRVEGAS